MSKVQPNDLQVVYNDGVVTHTWLSSCSGLIAEEVSEFMNSAASGLVWYTSGTFDWEDQYFDHGPEDEE